MCNSNSPQKPQAFTMYTCESLLEQGRIFSSIERLVEAHYGPIDCTLYTVKVKRISNRREDEWRFEREREKSIEAWDG